MGGNRGSRFKTYRNLFIVFIVSGIWHGAGWNFIVWGTLHGLAIVIHRIFKDNGRKMNKILAWFLTFMFVNLAWVFFRAPNLIISVQMLQKLIFIDFTPIKNILQNGVSYISIIKNFTLLEAINNMELTNDVISLIDNISSNNIEQDIDDILHILDTKINNIYVPRFRTDMTIPLYVSCRLYNKEYILEMIYQDGIPQVVEETTFDDNKLIPIGEVLKSATFVGGTKTANVNNNNSVICEYNDSHLNRFGVIKNKNTNTIEVYGSKKYISYLNGNQPDEDLAKYKDINAIITELTLKLTPSVKKYLYEESKKNNGRSK